MFRILGGVIGFFMGSVFWLPGMLIGAFIGSSVGKTVDNLLFGSRGSSSNSANDAYRKFYEQFYQNQQQGYNHGYSGNNGYNGFGNYQTGASDSNYADIGCSRTDSNEEIKKKYRKMVAQYHPDRIAGRGLSESDMKAAENKFKKIQESYNLIKKEKGL